MSQTQTASGATEVRMTVLWHCGVPMHIHTSRLSKPEDGEDYTYRTRYWKCKRCNCYDKTVDVEPLRE